jgi:hypothetical protein
MLQNLGFISHWTTLFFISKNTHLLAYSKIIAVYCAKHTQYINRFCEHNTHWATIVLLLLIKNHVIQTSVAVELYPPESIKLEYNIM